MRERGLSTHSSCVFRRIQIYAPEADKRCHPHLKSTNRSYRVDETYLKVKGKTKYLFQAVDSTGQTIDFLLTAQRDAATAKRFFRKVLQTVGHPSLRVINVDKNSAYPRALATIPPIAPKIRYSTAHGSGSEQLARFQRIAPAFCNCFSPDAVSDTTGIIKMRPSAGEFAHSTRRSVSKSCTWVSPSSQYER